MNLHSIRWRLPLSYIAIALVAALASGLMMLAVLRGYYQQRERQYLERNVVPIALTAEQILQATLPEKTIADQVAAWSFLLQARVQIFKANGGLLADSGTPNSQRILMVSNLDAAGGRAGGIFEMPVDATIPLTATIPLNGPAPASGIFLLPAGPPAGAANDVIVVNDCSPGDVCPVGVSVGTFISGTEPITRPIAISMSLASSPYGFEMDANAEISEPRSTQRIEQTLHDTAGNIVGRIVVSDGPGYGAEIVMSVARAWAIASLLALAVAGVTGWLASRRMTAPVLRLTAVTARMTQGDLSARTDVSTPDEFGALGRSFDQMAEQIEGLVGTLRRFVADAAHELNTPITALQTDLELARKMLAEAGSRQARPAGTSRVEPVETHELVETLSCSQQQLTRLQGLVRSLLDLSRLEGQTSLGVRQPVDLAELVQMLAEIYASRAEQAEIKFELTLPGEPVIISGDPAQLNMALGNLLDNALKFTPPGGTVRLSLEKLDAQVSLGVEDTGIGIPAEDLPLLFQRFHRGRNSAAFPGNGLGLAIVKAIVDAHGGTIEAASHSQLTTFHIQLGAAIPVLVSTSLTNGYM
jgi:signal transduction histidine kinase